MMKVYILTTGEYSSTEILGIFTEFADAVASAPDWVEWHPWRELDGSDSGCWQGHNPDAEAQVRRVTTASREVLLTDCYRDGWFSPAIEEYELREHAVDRILEAAAE